LKGRAGGQVEYQQAQQVALEKNKMIHGILATAWKNNTGNPSYRILHGGFGTLAPEMQYENIDDFATLFAFNRCRRTRKACP
jgi:hypothetical protein